MPDAVFIEDTAVVIDEVAIIARPGAVSRRAEVPLVEQTLTGYRSLARIEAPGTVDGGDVMTIGKCIFVGVSSRTNVEAIQQLQTVVSPFGYDVRPVTVKGCLHLKSAVTAAGTATVLINPAWAPVEQFQQFEVIQIHPDEPYAANVVVAGNSLIFPASFPRTRERLEARGLRVTTVDVSELAKAEGAVTCCSLIFKEVSEPK
jgi:dimethylargininase